MPKAPETENRKELIRLAERGGLIEYQRNIFNHRSAKCSTFSTADVTIDSPQQNNKQRRGNLTMPCSVVPHQGNQYHALRSGREHDGKWLT